MDFDYTNIVRDLDYVLDKIYSKDLEFGKYRIDITGRFHDSNILYINESYNIYRSDIYYKV
jgi:hypothetical protein